MMDMRSSSVLQYYLETDRETRSPAWYYATTLTERVQALCSTHDKSVKQQDLRPSAHKRLSRWRSQAPFKNDVYFAQRLESDGIDENILRSLLGETAEEVRNKFSHPPDWLVEFVKACENFESADSYPFCNFFDSQNDGAFLALTTPILWHGCNRLRQGIHLMDHSYSVLPFDKDITQTIFLANLLPQLTMIINRTMALERDQKL